MSPLFTQTLLITLCEALQLFPLPPSLHSSTRVIWTVSAAKQRGCVGRLGPSPGYAHLLVHSCTSKKKKGRWNMTTWLRFYSVRRGWRDENSGMSPQFWMHAVFHNMQGTKIGKRRTSADCRLWSDSIIHQRNTSTDTCDNKCATTITADIKLLKPPVVSSLWDCLSPSSWSPHTHTPDRSSIHCGQKARMHMHAHANKVN